MVTWNNFGVSDIIAEGAEENNRRRQGGVQKRSSPSNCEGVVEGVYSWPVCPERWTSCWSATQVTGHCSYQEGMPFFPKTYRRRSQCPNVVMVNSLQIYIDRGNSTWR